MRIRFIYLLIYLFTETMSHCIALEDMELAMETGWLQTIRGPSVSALKLMGYERWAATTPELGSCNAYFSPILVYAFYLLFIK